MAAAAGGESLHDKLTSVQESQRLCYHLLESQHQIMQIFMEEVRRLRHAIEDLEDLFTPDASEHHSERDGGARAE